MSGQTRRASLPQRGDGRRPGEVALPLGGTRDSASADATGCSLSRKALLRPASPGRLPPGDGDTLHRAVAVSDSVSGRCVRGEHLDDQLSDPTRLLVEREVTRVGDRDDGHVRALLEREPFVVG
jgi:hypothetical protein